MRRESDALLAIRTRAAALFDEVDQLLSEDPDVPRSAEDREILAVTAMVVGGFRPRTRADVLRFARAVKSGDDGWLLVRSMPGEQRVDGAYFARLPRELRGFVDGR